MQKEGVLTNGVSLLSLFKHCIKPETSLKKFPRGKYQDRRDLGRGCGFFDPLPMSYIAHCPVLSPSVVALFKFFFTFL